MSDAGVRGVFYCLEQVIVSWIERDSKRTVCHDAADMATEVDLHYIVFLQNSLVSDVRSPVGRAVVQARASGEGNAGLKATGFDQTSVRGLDLIADVHDLHARFDELLSPLPGVSVDFSGASQGVVVGLQDLLASAELGVADAVTIVVAPVLLNFTDWELACFEELSHRYHRWFGLLPVTSLPTA